MNVGDVVSRLIAMLSVVLAAACADRSEGELQAEFDDFVRARSACNESPECTLIMPGCPLGCDVAVNVAHANTIRRKAEELVEEYESGGQTCTYNCAPPPEPECRMGHCSLGP